MSRELKVLEEKIGYRFENFQLLKQAMIHSSYANERHLSKHECNERLEFLGDAVLELVCSEFLFFEHAQMPEGEPLRSRLQRPAEALLPREPRKGATDPAPEKITEATESTLWNRGILCGRSP